jgi:sulfotransferase
MQIEKIYFMAGMPRSGSTLLGAILNQNPRFYSEPSSPMLEISRSIPQIFAKSEHFHAFPKQKNALAVSQAAFQAYYHDAEKPVIIDKNRGWPTQIRGLEQCITSKAKILCPVRNVDEILASFLKIARENPFNPESGRLNFIDQSLVMLNMPVNDESRCEFLMSEKGLIGQSAMALQQALKDNFGDRLHFIEYNNLVLNPKKTLEKIYEFLEEKPYDGHDFSNIQNAFSEKDAEVFNVPDLHEIAPKMTLSKTNPKKILPPKFYDFCKNKEFWRNIDKEEGKTTS